MNTFQLQLFLILSQTLNFTKTADQLFISQPSVSNNLKMLEDSLGVKLLNRDSRNVTLTPEGKEFVDYANQMLTIQMEAENRIQNMSAGRLNRLRIAILPSTADIFSAYLRGYSRKQPNIQVYIDVKEGADMIQAVRLCSHDLYFANHYMIPSNDSFDSIEIALNQLYVFMHCSIAGKIDLNDWSTMNGLSFVSLPKTDFSLSNQIMDVCSRRGYHPEIVDYYRSVDALVIAVNAGLGLTILPSSLKQLYNLPRVVTMPIEGSDATVKTIIAWQSHCSNPEIRNFIDYISHNTKEPERHED